LQSFEKRVLRGIFRQREREGEKEERKRKT
jgi:hypothetical protein